MIENLVFSIEDTRMDGSIYPEYSIGEMFFGVSDFLTDKEEGGYNFIEVSITKTNEGFKAEVYDKDIIYNKYKASDSYKVTRFELVHTLNHHYYFEEDILIKSRDFVKEFLLHKQYIEHHILDANINNYHIDLGLNRYIEHFERVKEQY